MRISKSVVLVLALCGCGLFGKKEEGGDVPGAIDAAAIVAVPGTPIGKNSAGVARFATEVPQNEPKMIGQLASPRTSPSGGVVIAQLKTGTIVTRIATNAGHSLIVFPDPNIPADNLMGWVTDAAFSAAIVPRVDAGVVVVDAGAPVVVDAGAPAVVDAGAEKKQPTCKAGSVPITLPVSWGCRKSCTKDADCVTKTKKCEDQKIYLAPAGTPTTAKTCHDDQ